MGNLASIIDELLATDPRELPGPALAAELVEGRRHRNRADAVYLKQLAVLDRTGAALADYGSTAAWARAVLLLSPARASRGRAAQGLRARGAFLRARPGGPRRTDRL